MYKMSKKAKIMKWKTKANNLMMHMICHCFKLFENFVKNCVWMENSLKCRYNYCNDTIIAIQVTESFYNRSWSCNVMLTSRKRLISSWINMNRIWQAVIKSKSDWTGWNIKRLYGYLNGVSCHNLTLNEPVHKHFSSATRRSVFFICLEYMHTEYMTMTFCSS